MSSGYEILLAVAVFCFAWQRRMSLGQGGVEWGGAEVPMGEREKEKRKSVKLRVSLQILCEKKLG